MASFWRGDYSGAFDCCSSKPIDHSSYCCGQAFPLSSMDQSGGLAVGILLLAGSDLLR